MKGAIVMSSPMSNDDYQAQSDVSTLVQAAEITKDKKRFAAAQKYAQKKIESMEGVFGEDDGKDDKPAAK